jgi:hypothetical protein
MWHSADLRNKSFLCGLEATASRKYKSFLSTNKVFNDLYLYKFIQILKNFLKDDLVGKKLQINHINLRICHLQTSTPKKFADLR